MPASSTSRKPANPREALGELPSLKNGSALDSPHPDHFEALRALLCGVSLRPSELAHGFQTAWTESPSLIDPRCSGVVIADGRIVAACLANITSLNDLLPAPMKLRIPDPYTQCEQLDGWDLYAVDGHDHHAACFDKKAKTPRANSVPFPPGTFPMNMRTHHMSCLGMANPSA